jgi:hypothetical protein
MSIAHCHDEQSTTISTFIAKILKFQKSDGRTAIVSSGLDSTHFGWK